MQGEYRGDFTRDTFHPAKHFSRVLLQQGRVQLDADWNEQTAILLHYLRGLARDLIGPFGGLGAAPGFGIQPNPPLTNDFQIGAGHYYVDGILCELNATPVPVTVIDQNSAPPNQIQIGMITVDGVQFQSGQWVELLDLNGASLTPPVFASIDAVVTSAQRLTVKGTLASALVGTPLLLRRITTYLSQPDFPNPGQLKNASSATANYLVYLDVWERHLTNLEDGSIREVALGGPDTASRAKVVSLVSVTGTQPNPNKDPIPLAKPPGGWLSWVKAQWPKWAAKWQPANRGLLKARVQPTAVSTDPCVTSPMSSYRGAENQLYRVEIHNGGIAWTGKVDSTGKPVVTGDEATFKWSRENGSVVFPILKLATGSGVTTATLANLGRDQHLSLSINDWVEVVDDGTILSGTRRQLLQVQAIDTSGMRVTLAGTATATSAQALLRRWDQQSGDTSQGG